MPKGFGLNVLQQYVDGETDIDGALEMLKAEYPAGGAASCELNNRPGLLSV